MYSKNKILSISSASAEEMQVQSLKRKTYPTAELFTKEFKTVKRHDWKVCSEDASDIFNEFTISYKVLLRSTLTVKEGMQLFYKKNFSEDIFSANISEVESHVNRYLQILDKGAQAHQFDEDTPNLFVFIQEFSDTLKQSLDETNRFLFETYIQSEIQVEKNDTETITETPNTPYLIDSSLLEKHYEREILESLEARETYTLDDYISEFVNNYISIFRIARETLLYLDIIKGKKNKTAEQLAKEVETGIGKIRLNTLDLINRLRRSYEYPSAYYEAIGEAAPDYEVEDLILCFATYQNELGKMIHQTFDEYNNFFRNYHIKEPAQINHTEAKTCLLSCEPDSLQASRYLQLLSLKTESSDRAKMGSIQRYDQTDYTTTGLPDEEIKKQETLHEVLLYSAIICNGIESLGPKKQQEALQQIFISMGLYHFHCKMYDIDTAAENESNKLLLERIKQAVCTLNGSAKTQLEYLFGHINFMVEKVKSDPVSQALYSQFTPSVLINLALSKSIEAALGTEASIVGYYLKSETKRYAGLNLTAANLLHFHEPCDTSPSNNTWVLKVVNKINTDALLNTSAIKTWIDVLHSRHQPKTFKGQFFLALHYLSINPKEFSLSKIALQNLARILQVYIETNSKQFSAEDCDSRRSSGASSVSSRLSRESFSDTISLRSTISGLSATPQIEIGSFWEPHNLAYLTATFNILCNTRGGLLTADETTINYTASTVAATLADRADTTPAPGDYASWKHLTKGTSSLIKPVEKTEVTINVEPIRIAPIEHADLDGFSPFFDVSTFLPAKNQDKTVTEYISKLKSQIGKTEFYIDLLFNKYAYDPENIEVDRESILEGFRCNEVSEIFLAQFDNRLNLTTLVYNYFLLKNIFTTISKIKESSPDDLLRSQVAQDALYFFKDPALVSDWLQLNVDLHVCRERNPEDYNQKFHCMRLLNVLSVCEQKLNGSVISKEQLFVIEEMIRGENIYKEAGFGKTMLETVLSTINKGFTDVGFSLHVKPFAPETSHFIPFVSISEMIEHPRNSHFYITPERLKEMHADLSRKINSRKHQAEATIQLGILNSQVDIYFDEAHSSCFYVAGKSILDTIGSKYHQCVGLTATPDLLSLVNKNKQYLHSIYHSITDAQKTPLLGDESAAVAADTVSYDEFTSNMYPERNNTNISALLDFLRSKGAEAEPISTKLIAIQETINGINFSDETVLLAQFRNLYAFFTECETYLQALGETGVTYQQGSFDQFLSYYFNFPDQSLRYIDRISEKTDRYITDSSLKSLIQNNLKHLRENIIYSTKLISKYAEFFKIVESEETTLKHVDTADLSAVIADVKAFFTESKTNLASRELPYQHYGLCLPGKNINEIVEALKRADLSALASEEKPLTIVFRETLTDDSGTAQRGELKALVLKDGSYEIVEYENVVKNKEKFTTICCYTDDSCGGDFETLSRSLDCQYIAVSKSDDFTLSSVGQFMWRDRKPWNKHCKRCFSFADDLVEMDELNKSSFITAIIQKQLELSKTIVLSDIYDNKKRYLRDYIVNAVNSLIDTCPFPFGYERLKTILKERLINHLKHQLLNDEIIQDPNSTFEQITLAIQTALKQNMKEILIQGSVANWIDGLDFMVSDIQRLTEQADLRQEHEEIIDALFDILDLLTQAFKEVKESKEIIDTRDRKRAVAKERAYQNKLKDIFNEFLNPDLLKEFDKTPKRPNKMTVTTEDYAKAFAKMLTAPVRTDISIKYMTYKKRRGKNIELPDSDKIEFKEKLLALSEFIKANPDKKALIQKLIVSFIKKKLCSKLVTNKASIDIVGNRIGRNTHIANFFWKGESLDAQNRKAGEIIRKIKPESLNYAQLANPAYKFWLELHLKMFEVIRRPRAAQPGVALSPEKKLVYIDKQNLALMRDHEAEADVTALPRGRSRGSTPIRRSVSPIPTSKHCSATLTSPLGAFLESGTGSTPPPSRVVRAGKRVEDYMSCGYTLEEFRFLLREDTAVDELSEEGSVKSAHAGLDEDATLLTRGRDMYQSPAPSRRIEHSPLSSPYSPDTHAFLLERATETLTRGQRRHSFGTKGTPGLREKTKISAEQMARLTALELLASPAVARNGKVQLQRRFAVLDRATTAFFAEEKGVEEVLLERQVVEEQKRDDEAATLSGYSRTPRSRRSDKGSSKGSSLRSSSGEFSDDDEVTRLASSRETPKADTPRPKQSVFDRLHAGKPRKAAKAASATSRTGGTTKGGIPLTPIRRRATGKK